MQQQRRDYIIRSREGKGFAVHIKARPQGPWRKTRGEAEADLDKIMAQFRPCMRCGTEFQSEGWHNRMCDTCRRTDSGPW